MAGIIAAAIFILPMLSFLYLLLLAEKFEWAEIVADKMIEIMYEVITRSLIIIIPIIILIGIIMTCLGK